MMQTLFRNPLAGPFLIGITPGASFGIALVTLLGYALFPDSTGWAVPSLPVAALLGAGLVMMSSEHYTLERTGLVIFIFGAGAIIVGLIRMLLENL